MLRALRVGVRWGLGCWRSCTCYVDDVMLRMQKEIQFVRHDANAPKGRSKNISFTKGKGKALDPRLFTCTPSCSKIKNRLVERHWSPLQGQQAKETFAKVIVFGVTSKTLAWDKIHMLHMDLPNPQFHIRNELDLINPRIWSKTCLKPEFCKDCSLAPPKKLLGPLLYAARYLI